MYKIRKNLSQDNFENLIRLKDKSGNYPFKHAVYGIMLRDDNKNERKKLINLLYMNNGSPFDDILSYKEYHVIEYCFQNILVKNLYRIYSKMELESSKKKSM